MKRLFDDVARIAGLVSDRGWAERNAGNVSVDVTEECQDTAGYAPQSEEAVKTPIQHPELAGRCFMVTATGSRFRDIAERPHDHVVVARIDESLDGYHVFGRPEGRRTTLTSEFPSHLAVHAHLRRNDPTKKAVLHTHPDHLLALTHIPRFLSEEPLTRLLWSMHPEMRVVMPDGVGLVPYCMPGSEELAEATVKALERHRLVLWEKHGCVAVGHDVFEAFDLVDTAEKSARVFLLVASAGYEPEGLTEAQLTELSFWGAGRLPKGDAAPSEHDHRARNKDAKSVNSSAIGATENEVARRSACSEGRGFAFRQPPKTGR